MLLVTNDGNVPSEALGDKNLVTKPFVYACYTKESCLVQRHETKSNNCSNHCWDRLRIPVSNLLATYYALWD